MLNCSAGDWLVFLRVERRIDVLGADRVVKAREC